jgi:hypothetical protein
MSNSPFHPVLNGLAKRFFSEKSREKIRYWIKLFPAIFFSSNLTNLSKWYGSDKSDHGYTEIYERLFAWNRRQILQILEIGIGGGEDSRKGGNSLKMWSRFFPKAIIVGIDITDKKLVAYRRIRTEMGDQSDTNFLESLKNKYHQFDIIIDDGSHQNAHVICSFERLFHSVKPGGYYIIEDVGTSYWSEYGGHETDIHSQNTMMNYFRGFIDFPNVSYMRSAEMISGIDKEVGSIQFYPNLIVIQKVKKRSLV